MAKKQYETRDDDTLEYDLMWKGMSVTDAAKKYHLAPTTVRKIIAENNWKKVAKVCTKCQKIRPMEDFYVDKRAKDGRGSRCTGCNNMFGEYGMELSRLRRSIRERALKEAKPQPF